MSHLTNANYLVWPISYADYLAWIAADNKSRIILVEAEAYSSAALVTRYMSNCPFVSAPSDVPANQAYDDCVLSIPQFSTRMSEQMSGQSTPAQGDIDIANENGDRDGWLNDAWGECSVKLYLGDKAWSKSDFRKILDGTIDHIYAKDQRTLALKIRGRQARISDDLASPHEHGPGIRTRCGRIRSTATHGPLSVRDLWRQLRDKSRGGPIAKGRRPESRCYNDGVEVIGQGMSPWGSCCVMNQKSAGRSRHHGIQHRFRLCRKQ